MTRRHWICGVACVLVASCSEAAPDNTAPEPPPTTPSVDIVAELVDRFDVAACDAASPVGSLKKTGPEGLEMIRAYSVKADCLDALEEALPASGFVPKGEGGFIIGEGEQKTELVTLERAQGSADGGIQWEIVEK